VTDTDLNLHSPCWKAASLRALKTERFSKSGSRGMKLCLCEIPLSGSLIDYIGRF
jgi:hypothetical protein